MRRYMLEEKDKIVINHYLDIQLKKPHNIQNLVLI